MIHSVHSVRKKRRMQGICFLAITKIRQIWWESLSWINIVGPFSQHPRKNFMQHSLGSRWHRPTSTSAREDQNYDRRGGCRVAMLVCMIHNHLPVTLRAKSCPGMHNSWPMDFSSNPEAWLLL